MPPLLNAKLRLKYFIIRPAFKFPPCSIQSVRDENPHTGNPCTLSPGKRRGTVTCGRGGHRSPAGTLRPAPSCSPPRSCCSSTAASFGCSCIKFKEKEKAVYQGSTSWNNTVPVAGFQTLPEPGSVLVLWEVARHSREHNQNQNHADLDEGAACTPTQHFSRLIKANVTSCCEMLYVDVKLATRSQQRSKKMFISHMHKR